MLILASILSVVSTTSADEIDVWIGTSGKDGIFHLKLDTEKGRMSKPQLAAEMEGSGFLAMHPNGRIIYSTAKKAGEAGVAAFEIESTAASVNPSQLLELKVQERQLQTQFGANHPKIVAVRNRIDTLEKFLNEEKKTRRTGQLKFLNMLGSGDGGSACVGVDKTGNVLMSAQYGGGSTTTYTIAPDGSLGERVDVVEHGIGSGANAKRQAKSHPHWVGTSPDNRFLMVPDLGMDRVVVYELDAATAKLKPHSKIAVPPGSGPRHMKFHTSGKFAYVLNELTLTISVFEYDAESGGFKEIQLIETLPEDQKDKHLQSAAEIRVHPMGKFVYSSNRGHDSISVFSVDQETGKLTFVEREHIRGSIPRNFNLDPSGKWLIAAGQTSNTLALFEVDQATGELVFTRNMVNVPKPICILFGS